MWWGDRQREAIVFLSGDLPWVKRLLGINTCPEVASLYNKAVRRHSAKEYTGMDTPHSAEEDSEEEDKGKKRKKLSNVFKFKLKFKFEGST